MAIVSVDGAVDISIDVGDRLGVDSADLTSPALTQVVRQLNEIRRLWREDLIETWPVDTGRSQSNWSNRLEGLLWVLRNPVDYAEFVHPSGGDDGGYGGLGDSSAFMEARSEELLDAVFADLEAIVRRDAARAERTGGRQRSLIGFAARAVAARAISGRIFAAQAASFRELPARQRTTRQRRRFRSSIGQRAA